MNKRKHNRVAAGSHGRHEGQGADDRLLDYLEGRMDEAEQRAFEATLSDAGPESDALDGLYGMPNPEARKHVGAVNARLYRQIRRGNARRKRRQSPTYVIIAAIAVLLLIVAACMVAGKALRLF